MTRFHRTVLFALALVLAGCSSSSPHRGTGDGGNLQQGDGGADASTAVLTGISLAPQNPTLDIQGTTPASVAFTVIATFDDGHTEDVSNKTGYSLGDPTLGSFVAQNFISTTQKGGVTELTASYQGQLAGTLITLIDHQTFTSGSGFPADPSTPFSGPADATKNPVLVYPNDGVLLPPNLGRLEFHFIPKNSSELFQLSFENAITDVKVYFTCGTPVNGGCIYQPADPVWKALATGNRGGDPLTVTVKEADSAGTGVGTSNTIHIAFSHDDLNGGLYYWTTSTFPDGVSTAIMRYDFAGTQTSATRYLTAKDVKLADGGSSGVSCLGCHALSSDGTKVVAEVNGQNDGRLFMYDVSTTAPIVSFPAAGTSIFESWSPDGTRFVGVDHDNGNDLLRLHDGNTGAVLASIPGTGDSTHPADHPDWSSDGSKIVFSKMGIAGTCQRMHEGAIEMISQQPDGGWTAPSELVARATNVNNYYPAFAPDNSFVVFDQSKCVNGGGSSDITCDADTDPTATLYALPLDGGSPIVMASANAPGPLDVLPDGGVQTMVTDSFPKWSPFITQRTSDPKSKVMWLTFASTRNYGLRSPPAEDPAKQPEAALSRGTLLWMVAVDPAKLAQGIDPSYPAFALPFQDTTTSNHIAQWTQQVVKGACSEYGAVCDPNAPNCCANLTCQAGTGDPPQYTCQPIIN